jgi:diguanylate cyclase (GGDEF)-like protein
LIREAALAADLEPNPLLLRHLIRLTGADRATLMVGSNLVPACSLTADGLNAPPLPLPGDLVQRLGQGHDPLWEPRDGGVLGVIPLAMGHERIGLAVLTAPERPSEADDVAAYATFAALLLFQTNTRALMRRSEESFNQKLDMALGLYDLYEDAVGHAITDRLTGLGSRAYFEQRLVEQIDLSRRYRQPLSLLLIDVDHFKLVNDTHGHLVGDQVLSGMGFIVRGLLRLSDVAGRFGGEEFAIVLPTTDRAGALVLAERLREAIAHWKLDLADGPIRVTASMGVASLGSADQRPSDLIEAADRALYQAKRSGRNRVCSAP